MTTPKREQVTPEPFGYVSDGFPDGLHFKHKPWGEMHMLVHSVSAVYSASQLLQAIADAHAAGREQGLREAKEVCEGRSILRYLPANHFEIERSTEARSCAAAIEQLRGK